MMQFDYRGLKCPIPVLKAFKDIKKNPEIKLYEFICDDKTAPKDFKDLCSNIGLKLSKVIDKKNFYIIIISRN